MDAGRQLVFLDTHVVIWLADNAVERLSQMAAQAIENNQIAISSIVKLELQYLYEINRLGVTGEAIFAELAVTAGLVESSKSLAEIVAHASRTTWTRDVFDRLIVAEAACAQAPLITKDRHIRKHFELALW